MHYIFNRLRLTQILLSFLVLSQAVYADIRLEYTVDSKIVSSFYDTVVIPVFPNKDELDPVESWLETCAAVNAEEAWKTEATARRFLLAIDYEDAAPPKAVAGVVIETFDANATALLAYAATAKTHQGKGLYKRLIEKAVQDHPVLFLETESTSAPVLENEPMDRAARHAVHNKAGFTCLPLTYVQPPCSEDQGPVPNMHLLIHAKPGAVIQSEIVRKFINSFYAQYGAIGTDYHSQILSELDGAASGVLTTKGLPW